MRHIRVEQVGPEVFRVEVADGDVERVHLVTALPEDVDRLAAGRGGEGLVEESFEFVLKREPIGILPENFHLLLIARYHPDYLEEIPKRMVLRPGEP
ncbi:MAG: hypothetical protein ACRDJ4_03195 [Actinomycetota bacterium]